MTDMLVSPIHSDQTNVLMVTLALLDYYLQQILVAAMPIYLSERNFVCGPVLKAAYEDLTGRVILALFSLQMPSNFDFALVSRRHICRPILAQMTCATPRCAMITACQARSGTA